MSYIYIYWYINNTLIYSCIRILTLYEYISIFVYFRELIIHKNMFTYIYIYICEYISIVLFICWLMQKRCQEALRGGSPFWQPLQAWSKIGLTNGERDRHKQVRLESADRTFSSDMICKQISKYGMDKEFVASIWSCIRT